MKACRELVASLSIVLVAGCTSAVGARVETTAFIGEVTLPATPRSDPVEDAASEPLFSEIPLDEGIIYAVDSEFSDAFALEMTAPSDGVATYVEPGFFAIYNDVDRADVIVEVFDLRSTDIFNDSVLKLDMEFTDEMFSDAPDDVLGWFARRPGVAASPVVESTVLGRPARSLTYSIGTVEGAEPCLPDNDGDCLGWFAIGTIIVIWPTGYSGTLYETTVAGVPLLVHVRDRTNARAAVDLLRVVDE